MITRNTILLVVMILLSLAICAASNPTETENSKGIEFFDGTWSEALKLAKAENKPVFVDISTGWCGYCKKMKNKVYADPQVGEHYNGNFINVSIDAEKGEGKAIAAKYGVKGYPTLVFVHPDGTTLLQTRGYHKPDEFLELAEGLDW
jgi:thioredoxin 1